MKWSFTLLRKFNLSSALDESPVKSGPASVTDSEEIREFRRVISRLGEQLKAEQPPVEVPQAMHDCIMSAVRRNRPAAVRPELALARWWRAAACAVLTASGICWLVQQPADLARSDQSLNAAASALQMGGEMPPAITSAAMAPLSSELDHVSQDIGNVTEFVLAALP
jgi:hypothetical protein